MPREIGAVSETVTVTGGAQQLQTANATIGNVVEQKAIEALPPTAATRSRSYCLNRESYNALGGADQECTLMDRVTALTTLRSRD
jgi:hypothetical protein